MMRTPRPVRSGAIFVAAMLIGLVFSAGAQAAPGDLDTSFSGDGKQTTSFGGVYDEAAAVALQADGKIVAVGSPFGDRFILARYNPNGSLDTSFSNDGRRFTNFRGSVEGARGVAIQANGKIVAVGFAGDDADGDFDFALARYNPNGSLDTSFSGDGKQKTDFFGGASEGAGDFANGVAIQGDGKIIVVGRASDFDSYFALARYKRNGSLDTSFSGDGKQTTDFGGSGAADAVALQGNGKIVAVGSGEAGGVDDDFALARYNPNGSLDRSFSGDGKQATNFGASDFALGVAIQANGKIVAAGGTGSSGTFALARYNPTGSLDTSFSGDGKQTTGFGGQPGGEVVGGGMALQRNGKIVAVGVTSGNDDFALARYNPNGSLDRSFSGDGKQTTDFGGGELATGVAIQANDKIVVVGRAAGDFALARYLGG